MRSLTYKLEFSAILSYAVFQMMALFAMFAIHFASALIFGGVVLPGRNTRSATVGPTASGQWNRTDHLPVRQPPAS